MPDPDSPDSPDPLAAAADEVTAGTDKIAVPESLLREPAPSATPEPSEKALWAQIRDMSMAERVKLALRGNKDARIILLRDTNRQVKQLVLRNPRISEEEILMIAKDRNTDEEILAVVADSRDWTKVYAVRVALVENARTPVAKALRLLPTLVERDLGRLAKSKGVPNVIAVQARKLVTQLRERRS